MMDGNMSLVGESSGEAPKVPEEFGSRKEEVRPAQGQTQLPTPAPQQQDIQSMEQQLQQKALDQSKEALMEKIKREIERKLAELKDQVIIDIFEGGVRIQLVDKDKKPMFALASAEPTPDAKRILRVIADNINGLNNKIAIEGHTDSLSYASGKFTNWELSTERASAARKELERDGMSPDRLTRVAGYAATDPLIPENPADPRNRRISIMLMFQKPKSPPSYGEADGASKPSIYKPAQRTGSTGTISLGTKLDDVTEIKPVKKP